MKVQANTLRPGHVIEHGGKQYSVLTYTLNQPGKGNPFIQIEMRDVLTGVKTNERFRTQETVEKLNTDERECTMLYAEGEQITLMDSETYDQFAVPVSMAGDAAPSIRMPSTETPRTTFCPSPIASAAPVRPCAGTPVSATRV